MLVLAGGTGLGDSRRKYKATARADVLLPYCFLDLLCVCDCGNLGYVPWSEAGRQNLSYDSHK